MIIGLFKVWIMEKKIETTIMCWVCKLLALAKPSLGLYGI